MEKKKIIIIIFSAIVIILAGMGVYYFMNIDKYSLRTGSLEKMAIGVIPDNFYTLEKYQTIADYLTKYSDHTWYVVPLKDYGSFMTQMRLNQIQAGFMGSAVAYQMIINSGALPVARAEINGISTYNSYIFSRKDSGINSIAELKDKKFAYVDEYTSAGYFFPVYLLKTLGYNPDDFFKVSSFLGTHSKAISAVLSGDYDGGAAKDTAWRNAAKSNPDIDKNLNILIKEGPFPENAFMINADFGQVEVDELRGILLSLNNTEEGKDVLKKYGAERFIITDLTDFKTIKKIFNYLGKN